MGIPLDWPVTVDVEYDENGPELMCDGYVRRVYWEMGYEGTAPCRTGIPGMTWGDLEQNLLAHIAAYSHCEPGFSRRLTRDEIRRHSRRKARATHPRPKRRRSA